MYVFYIKFVYFFNHSFISHLWLSKGAHVFFSKTYIQIDNQKCNICFKVFNLTIVN
jgi:hypothetical protein